MRRCGRQALPESEFGDSPVWQAALHDQGARARSCNRCKGRRNLVRTPDRHGFDLDAGRLAGELNILEKYIHERIAGIPQRRDFSHRGQHVPEQLDAFAVRFRRHQRDAGHVPARTGQACDHACFDQIGDDRDDRNLTSSLLHRMGAGCVESDDDIGFFRDEFRRQPGKPFEPALR